MFSSMNVEIIWKTEVGARLNTIKNSFRTAKKTLNFSNTKIKWLMLFKEIIAVYTENHIKP
jgi:hypothetical protein